MKRIIALLMAALLVCAAAPAFAAKQTVLRIGGNHAADHEATATLKRIKERLEKATDNRVTLKIHPASQLGDYTLVYEDVMRGSVDAAHIFIPSQYDPLLEINSIPYLVTSYEQMEKVFSPGSFFYKTYSNSHEKLGVKLLGVYAEGFIGIGSKKAVDNTFDAAAKHGILLRIPALDVYKMASEDLGFSTTSIAYADLYSALQTGVADAWVGGTPQMNYHGFRDVIKYYLTYNIFVENTSYIINKAKFESLLPEDQKALEEIFKDESMKSFAKARQEDEAYLARMKEAGIEIIDLTDEQRKAFVERVVSVTWPKLESKFGKDVMDGLKKDLQ